MERGDPGINELDKACKEHDIAYDKFSDLKLRHIADNILKNKSKQIYKNKNKRFGEKAAAFAVSKIMKAKTKFGLGAVSNKKKKNQITFGNAIKNVKSEIKKKNIKNKYSEGKMIEIALKSAKKEMKHVVNPLGRPRVIPIPKKGGFLPLLIPILSGLSAIGALGGGVANIVKTIKEIKNAKNQLSENQRHNRAMEDIQLKNGKGLFIKPYRTGLGLFLNPKN